MALNFDMTPFEVPNQLKDHFIFTTKYVSGLDVYKTLFEVQATNRLKCRPERTEITFHPFGEYPPVD